MAKRSTYARVRMTQARALKKRGYVQMGVGALLNVSGLAMSSTGLGLGIALIGLGDIYGGSNKIDKARGLAARAKAMDIVIGRASRASGKAAASISNARTAGAMKAVGGQLFGRYDRMTTMLENGVPGAERSLGKSQQSLRNYFGLRGVTPAIAARSGAAASISRARQVLDRTAAARSMAASRKAVPRPAAARRPAAERKGGDGTTEGYYRNQGGKRVFVQGYATPPGRSR